MRLYYNLFPNYSYKNIFFLCQWAKDQVVENNQINYWSDLNYVTVKSIDIWQNQVTHLWQRIAEANWVYRAFIMAPNVTLQTVLWTKRLLTAITRAEKRLLSWMGIRHRL